ncbi:putative UV radiation resistance-associated gene protein [Podospora australis]|uniref:Autophagy-related protein 14 n=1 Tax=Podospora australis TaxID=1536484 RepID=A0AAN6WM70_9PEZI|nr:putative UV radiation resistance-associated gene protein [Podospora australis]
MSTESSRPLLLPQNRKLRHLRGISLRNLSFTRSQGRTADDAALNKSPAKLESLRNASHLHHALSSEELRPPAGRRRSTALSQPGQTNTLQKRLEETFDSKLADAFFSLHVEGEEEPVYISEVSERSTNFDFGFFELSDLASTITQTPKITIKIWTKRNNETWNLLLEDEVDLRTLNWLGSLQNVHFPPNSLVFHMVDGIYSLELSNQPPSPAAKQSIAPEPTSSYNALMRLATLDNSIQDALATRDALTRQINDFLESETKDELPEVEDKLALATKYLRSQQREVEAARKRNEEMRASIAARRKAIAEGKAVQEKAALDVNNAREKLAHSQKLLQQTKEQIHGQRRRICEDLDRIYRITSLPPPAPPLTFTICGLPLPNTNYNDSSYSTQEDSLSAALGYVAQLTDALQYYLSVPLPYPIRAVGSRSTIRDDISKLPDGQRDFPLYVPRGGSSAQYRFDYGWFLLNQDIEALCLSQGLKVVDIRHTLPNLKYLLYVCSAGTEEVPERKKGGVRGLWAGRMRGLTVPGITTQVDDTASSFGGSTAGSRRGSDASSVAAGGGNPHRAKGEELRGKMVMFDEGDKKLTLRTKGLRESAAR